MIRDLEKGIGHLLGHEEPETAARRKAYYRELIRQKVEGPISVVNAPEANVTTTPIPIDITKYNGPPTNALGHSRNQQRRMARQWLTDKNSGNSRGAWKDFVKERRDELKKQNESNRYLAKGLDKNNPYNLKFPYNKTTGTIENQKGEKADPRKAVKEQQFLDQRIEGAKTIQYVADNNTMYADQPQAYWQWDGAKQDYVDINQEQKNTNKEPGKTNKETTNNKERNVRQV